jgi:hypothetical protein
LGTSGAVFCSFWETFVGDIRTDMPILCKHAGIWDGSYRYYDAAGNKVDEHASRLVCRLPESGPYEYHQTNFYTWDDGRTDIRDFPANYRDGRIWFDNELIKGWAAEVGLDDFGRTLMLNWVRVGEPDMYLYEMIQVSDCGQLRHRVWHWYKAGALIQRTLIDEKKVSDSWDGY